MAGNDFIRLTEADNNQASFKLLETATLDITKGLSLTFDFASYGGNGGDGFSVILLDGSVSPTTAGAFGGSLGYAKRTDNGVEIPGIQGGIIGVGFDEFGNYSNPEEGRTGGPGRIEDSIAIRGSLASGNAYLAGTGTLAPGIDNPGEGATRENSKRKAKIDVVARGNQLFASVKVDFNNDGVFSVTDANEVNPALQDVLIGDINSIPKTYRFGFASATGAATNIHEVGNFVATTADGTVIPIGAGQVIIGDNKGKDNLIGQNGNDTLIGGGRGDTQTGKGGGDRFVFSGPTKRSALRTSRLRDLDRITDFNQSQNDRFILDFDSNLATVTLPRRLFNAGEAEGSSLKRAAKAIYRDRNSSKRGNQAVRKDEALFFTFGSRTYLSVNDDKAGFQPRRDLLADVTGITFKAGDTRNGRITATDYFV